MGKGELGEKRQRKDLVVYREDVRQRLQHEKPRVLGKEWASLAKAVHWLYIPSIIYIQLPILPLDQSLQRTAAEDDSRERM